MSTVEAAPELREVRGPAAIGGGRQRFGELLWLIHGHPRRRTPGSAIADTTVAECLQPPA